MDISDLCVISVTDMLSPRFFVVGNQQAAVDWKDQEDCKGGDSVGKKCESKFRQLDLYKSSLTHCTALPIYFQHCLILLA